MMTDMKFNEKNSEDGEILHRFLIQMGFNSYLKNKNTREKTAISHLKKKTPTLLPANEEKSDDLESEDESWGSDEIVDYYDTYDIDIYDREVKQSGSGLVTFPRKAS